MAAPSDLEGLRAAWRVLGFGPEGGGWRTIPISVRAPCTLFAGKRMPGGEEAVLVGFRNIPTMPESNLPQGHGFEVFRLKADPTGGDHLVLALARRTGASLEFFGMVADDLVGLLDGCELEAEEGVLRRFLGRIRAWQDFMDRRREDVLSEEAEQGLFGELVMLERMIESGAPAGSVLDAWQGPVDGIQDFMLGAGAIEVKTTISTGVFPATISSLEQLDETLRQPLFFVAVRLGLDPSGATLPGMVDIIREKLRGSRAALDLLEVRLIQAGYLPTAVARYTRRFLHVSSTIFAVHGDFPRLRRADVHPAIRKTRYEIAIDTTGAADVGLKRALELLGGLNGA
jgi:hypothetical protein